VELQEKELLDIVTNKGNNILALSMQQPLLLVFLRHFGCAFCRKAMSDLSKIRTHYEKKGVRLIFFHLSDDQTAEKYFKKYKLDGVEYVADPQCLHYSNFGLAKGTFNQLLGLKVLMKGIPHAFNPNTGWNTFIGDGFQMPGVFAVQEGEIKASFVHQLASDEPDYDLLIAGCELKRNRS
jgi:thiol-disulfide isomerase/thioredoxin